MSRPAEKELERIAFVFQGTQDEVEQKALAEHYYEVVVNQRRNMEQYSAFRSSIT